MTRDADAAIGRTELDAAARELIRSTPGTPLASGYQASVHLYSTPAGEVIVKRPHGGSLGFVWRHLLRREQQVYERLRDVPGVPRCYGLVDGHDLALEYIAGASLRGHEHLLADPQRFFAALLETLHAMHAAGVAHRDLKRKANLIIGAGERPYLIDFGVASLRHDVGTAVNRLVFDYACRTDYNSWIKLKYGRRVAEISAADALLYRPSLLETVARGVRIVWQTATLRRPRQRWRREREARKADRKDT